MRVIIKKNYEELSLAAAELVASLVRSKPECVLGLATGSTPLGLYGELIRMHREGGLDFSSVTSFNLDEYYGLEPKHPHSYRRFMEEKFFSRININNASTYLPDGTVSMERVADSCREYERRIQKAGGIDLQILGIGGDGHIAFNEPGSSLASRTRLVALDEKTLEDNARFFEQGVSDVPAFAISMGIATILEASEILILAAGVKKAEVVRRAIEGPVTSMVTASALQMHPKVTALLDEEAADSLTRISYYRFAADAEKQAKMRFF